LGALSEAFEKDPLIAQICCHDQNLILEIFDNIHLINLLSLHDFDPKLLYFDGRL